MSTDLLEFRRYDAASARDLRHVVEEVYTASYTEAIANGGPFHSAEAFMTRFDSYVKIDGFDLVIAYDQDKPAGQTWGWPLSPDTKWWDGLLTQTEPGFTDEDGTRTFALSEIMVHEDLTGRGIARIEDRWAGTGQTGDRFRDPNHVYAADLDLFGRGCLFELLSTARLPMGENQLAHWLKTPSPEIRIASKASRMYSHSGPT